MAFNQATWIDRDSEHPNRRTLTNVNDPTDVKTYDLSRAEGTVTTQGTPIGASTMNDLETRIASAFTEVNNNMPVANPSGAATDELEKVKIGNTIFSVEGTSVEKGTIQNVAIASFSDGADNVPVSSLIVDIDAVQDLHGYDKPWSGGGGKNKLALTVASVEAAQSGWSNHKMTRNNVEFTILTDSDGNFIGIDANGVASARTEIRIYIGELKANTIINGAISNSAFLHIWKNGASTNVAEVKGDNDYTFTEDISDGYIYLQINSGTDLSHQVFKPMVRESGQSAEYAPYSNICPISGHSTCTIKVNDDIDDPQTEITTAIALGQTVYGGSLNVTTGELTITHGYVDLGSLNWYYNSTYDFFSASISDIIDGYSELDIKSSVFKSIDALSNPNMQNAPNWTICHLNTTVKVKDTDYTDADAFKTALANETICYELATPTTATLTPTEVRTLLNDNNIFADTGNINELVYFKTGCEALARLIEAYECYTEVAGTLAAGQTSITLTNDAITSNSTIDVYTDADVDYNSISVTTGSVTITFDAQASNLNVKVRIS